MTSKKPDARFWHDEILPRIFTDAGFRQFNRHCRYREINGAKLGVVLATKNPNFTSFALNKTEFDRLVAAKRGGRIDEAFVVMTAIEVSGAFTYRRSADAEELYTNVLANLQPRSGPYGPFWVLPADPDDEPF